MARGPRSGDTDLTTPNEKRPGYNAGRNKPNTPPAPNRGRARVHSPEMEPPPAPKRGPNTPMGPIDPYGYRGGKPDLGELADMVDKSRPKPRGGEASSVIPAPHVPRIPAIGLDAPKRKLPKIKPSMSSRLLNL